MRKCGATSHGQRRLSQAFDWVAYFFQGRKYAAESTITRSLVISSEGMHEVFPTSILHFRFVDVGIKNSSTLSPINLPQPPRNQVWFYSLHVLPRSIDKWPNLSTLSARRDPCYHTHSVGSLSFHLWSSTIIQIQNATRNYVVRVTTRLILLVSHFGEEN